MHPAFLEMLNELDDESLQELEEYSPTAIRVIVWARRILGAAIIAWFLGLVLVVLALNQMARGPGGDGPFSTALSFLFGVTALLVVVTFVLACLVWGKEGFYKGLLYLVLQPVTAVSFPAFIMAVLSESRVIVWWYRTTWEKFYADPSPTGYSYP